MSGSEKSLVHTKVHSSTHWAYEVRKCEWSETLIYGIYCSKKCDMFLWTSGFQNPLVHTDFDMFVDE